MPAKQIDQLIQRYNAIVTDFCLNSVAILGEKDSALFILDSLLLNPLADEQIELISLAGLLWQRMAKIPVIDADTVSNLFSRCTERIGQLQLNAPVEIDSLLVNSKIQRLISIAIAIDQTHPSEATSAFKKQLPDELVLLHEILLSQGTMGPKQLASKTQSLLKGLELLQANDQTFSDRMRIIQVELQVVEDEVYRHLPLLRKARRQETWPSYDAA